MIYLDSAATTLQKPRRVSKAVKKAVNTLASPGRGGHRHSMKAAETAFECRTLAAALFGMADPSNVVFTSNATHGLNIAIKALAKPGSRALVSGYEHNSVMRPLRASGAEIIIARSELFEPEMAVFEFERWLETERISLVVLNHMSNVFGYILPAERIAEQCKKYGVPFILDASQSAGCVDIDFDSLGAAFVAMPGHKGLYGPQGTGLLLCAPYIDVAASGLMQGGSGGNSVSDTMPKFLPDGLEAGTHNMPGIAGLFTGLEYVSRRKPKIILEHAQRLMTLAARELAVLPGVRVFTGGHGDCHGGVLSFQVESVDCESAAEQLSELGFAVRAGLHCAPEAHRTVGTATRGTVRVSVSRFNTEREIRLLAEAVAVVAKRC